MDKITAEVEMLEVGDGEEERLRSSVQRKILGQLQYPAMTNRYEEVLQAHPQTFDWIFCIRTMRSNLGVTSGRGSESPRRRGYLLDQWQSRLWEINVDEAHI